MKLTVQEIYQDSEKYLNGEIVLEGWIRTLRASKNFGFIEINDGTFFKNLQIVFGEDLEYFKDISKLPISSSIKVTGILVPTPEAKQPFEVKATEILIEGYSNTDYPLQKETFSRIFKNYCTFKTEKQSF